LQNCFAGKRPTGEEIDARDAELMPLHLRVRELELNCAAQGRRVDKARGRMDYARNALESVQNG
jgi:hypothetical protein